MHSPLVHAGTEPILPHSDPMRGLPWIDSVFPTCPGGNAQAGIFALWGGWSIRPWKSFDMILWRWHRANCLALRGTSLLKPLFNTKAKLLGLFLSVGHCSSDDTFQASFGTKSRWFKSTFQVNICIFMAKRPPHLWLFDILLLLVKLCLDIYCISNSNQAD